MCDKRKKLQELSNTPPPEQEQYPVEQPVNDPKIDNDNHIETGYERDVFYWSNGNSPTTTINKLQFDENTLPELICQRQWSKALNRAELYPHEVSTPIFLPKFGNGLCQILPLHLAVSVRPFPPPSFIQWLIQMYQEAVHSKEQTWGLLPLHFACMSLHRFHKEEKRPARITTKLLRIEAHVQIIQHLIQCYPEAVKIREELRGMLPIHLAAAALFPSCVLDVLISAYPESVFVEDEYGDMPLDMARRGIQWRRRYKQKEDEGDDLISAMIRIPAQKEWNLKLEQEWKPKREFVTSFIPPKNEHLGMEELFRFRPSEDECSPRRRKESDLDVRKKRLTAMRSKECKETKNGCNKENESPAKSPTKTALNKTRKITLQLQGMNLQDRSMSLLKKKRRSMLKRKKQLNAFFELSIKRDGTNSKSFSSQKRPALWKVIYRSNPIQKTSNPTWDMVDIIFVRELDLHTPIKIAVFNKDDENETNDLFGAFETTIHGLKFAVQKKVKFTVTLLGKVNGLVAVLNA